MPSIDPSARVADGARLADDVSVGPFCTIGPDVEIAAGGVLHSHVVVAGRTSIGPRASIYPFAVLGQPPQSLSYRGEPSRLVIGSDAIIREHATLNPGTSRGGMVTRVGDHCFMMTGAHVGHDCQVGDRVIFANGATLGGHCAIGDHVFLGGFAAIHQFCRVGDHAMVGGLTGIVRDLIPFGTAFGTPASLIGLNFVGLKRRGFPSTLR